jgi:hypothetical protein
MHNHYLINQINKTSFSLHPAIFNFFLSGKVIPGPMKLSPNPAKSYILIQYDAPLYMETMIKIINHEKKQVQCLNTNFKEGVNQALVNIENLVPGNYMVQFFHKETLVEQMLFNKN